MASEAIERLNGLLNDLERICGDTFIWKSTGSMKVVNSLDLSHRVHTQFFCTSVKGQGLEFEDACVINDTEVISRRALELKKPFLNLCHAGVYELVIPFFQGDHYAGAILTGPFLTGKSECTYSCALCDYENLKKIDEGTMLALSNIVTEVLRNSIGGLVRYDHKNPVAVLNKPEKISDKRIADIIRYMEDNFRQKITVSALARKCALSPSRFLHLFKKETQRSFSEYWQRLKVNEACRLLASTGLRISEVAEACGLPEQSRFSALFRRYCGMSPGQYRKTFQNITTT